ARFFHQPADGPALRVYRGSIPRQLQGGAHSGASLGAQRSGGVPVEIRSFSHRSCQYVNTVLPLDPAKSLLFAPVIVLEARNRPALIACVEAGKSGIRIIRIILN